MHAVIFHRTFSPTNNVNFISQSDSIYYLFVLKNIIERKRREREIIPFIFA